MGWIEPFAIVVFACLVIGYLWGHRRGEIIGKEAGALYVPLELRRQSLLAGQCQICGSYPPESVPLGSDVTGQTLEFVKMHCLGNDYICVDLFRHNYQLDWSEIARLVSDRHCGIGSDGLILIMPSHLDGRVRFFQVDGTEGRLDGAGLCCAAKYLYDTGLVKKTSLTIETIAGNYQADVSLDRGRVCTVKVDMGEPRLVEQNSQVQDELGDRTVVENRVPILGYSLLITALSIGELHGVIFVDDVSHDLESFPVGLIGKAIENHPLLSDRTHVEFAVCHSPSSIKIRVWERGSGETAAGGSGACAAAVAGHLLGKSSRKVAVHQPGGDLIVEWCEIDNHVYMTGLATVSFSGQVNLDLLMKKKSTS